MQYESGSDWSRSYETTLTMVYQLLELSTIDSTARAARKRRVESRGMGHRDKELLRESNLSEVYAENQLEELA